MGLSLVHSGNDEVSIVLLSLTGGVTLAKIDLERGIYRSNIPQALGVLGDPRTFEGTPAPDLNLKTSAHSVRGVMSDHWADGLKLGLSDALLDTLRGFAVQDLEAASVYLGLTHPKLRQQPPDIYSKSPSGFWSVVYVAQGDGFGWCWVGADLKTRELVRWSDRDHWSNKDPSRTPTRGCWNCFLGQKLVPEKMRNQELFGYLTEQVKTSPWVGRTPRRRG